MEQNPMIRQLMDSVARLETRLRKYEECIVIGRDAVTVTVGATVVRIHKASVKIQAGEIELRSSGKITVKADGDVAIRGARIREN